MFVEATVGILSVSFVAPVITDHEVRDNAATARNNSQLFYL